MILHQTIFTSAQQIVRRMVWKTADGKSKHEGIPADGARTL